MHPNTSSFPSCLSGCRSRGMDLSRNANSSSLCMMEPRCSPLGFHHLEFPALSHFCSKALVFLMSYHNLGIVLLPHTPTPVCSALSQPTHPSALALLILILTIKSNLITLTNLITLSFAPSVCRYTANAPSVLGTDTSYHEVTTLFT